MKTQSVLFAFLAPLVILILASCAPSPSPTAEAVQNSPSQTVEKDVALFINLIDDEPHRVRMALSFGMKFLELGHPLIIFLNDRGVLVGSKNNADQFVEQQKMLNNLIQKGAVVFICPMCMEHYGVKETDLLPGLRIANAPSLEEYLFKPGTRTLTW